MCRIAAIGDLVTHIMPQLECSAVTKFGIEFSLDNIQYVSEIAPVICRIASAIFDQAHPQIADAGAPPQRRTSSAVAVSRPADEGRERPHLPNVVIARLLGEAALCGAITSRIEGSSLRERGHTACRLAEVTESPVANSVTYSQQSRPPHGHRAKNRLIAAARNCGSVETFGKAVRGAVDPVAGTRRRCADAAKRRTPDSAHGSAASRQRISFRDRGDIHRAPNCIVGRSGFFGPRRQTYGKTRLRRHERWTLLYTC